MTTGSLKAHFLRKDIQKRALIIALIVGTLLNCINQGPDIADGAAPNWFKMMLTFMVPYCVSIYSGISTARQKQ